MVVQGEDSDRGPPIDAADLPPLDQPTTRQPKQRQRKARRPSEGAFALADIDGWPVLPRLSTIVTNFRSQFRRGPSGPFRYDEDEASHR